MSLNKYQIHYKNVDDIFISVSLPGKIEISERDCNLIRINRIDDVE